MEKCWQRDLAELAASLAVDLSTGLSADEAQQRLAKAGPNQLREEKGESAWQLFFSQFRSFIIWVLIVAAFISGFLKEWIDTGAIVGIVVLNAVLGFIQEYRAEKSLAALRKLASPTSKVFRGGQQAVIASADLVPGDLVDLEAGDHIPADGRIVTETPNFAVQEASLTGESTPVLKHESRLEADEVPLAERTNMVFMGTSVVAGKARMLVVGTGMQTELGRIAGLIQQIKPEQTPLQKKLDDFGRVIVKICFLLVLLVFALEMLRGGRMVEVFLTAVSLAVAAIPEGLPAVVTIALALGVHRMVRRNALIRKLPSVETLGCATVICSDKTGTLTKNEMTVQAVYAGGRLYRVTGVGYEPRGQFELDGKAVWPREHPALRTALLCGTLCNGAQLAESGGEYRVIGDPTEGAILTAAAKMGLAKQELEKEYAFFEELPFDSERKMMSVLRTIAGGKRLVFTKGAPDVLLGRCAWVEEGMTRKPLGDDQRAEILRVNEELGSQAMRVLATAYREMDSRPGALEAPKVERDLVFTGLVAMIDPARPEVKDAILKCKSAGIRAVMITGDHKNTAVAIARDLGLYEEGSRALSGGELDRIPEDSFAAEVEHIPVYARVSPDHKLRIVRAWRGRGHVAAMTGDGVNDAPAVKEADIGIAMGITGTDVTKEVSDMIVTDDNFASIVAAVEEGRGIYDNILKFVRYLLSCNAGEILVMVIASLVGMPVPLLPIHILWVNLVTDGLPALALGVDPVDRRIMERPPRLAAEPIIDRKSGALLLIQGLFIALCTLFAFSWVYWVQEEGLGRARTAAFMVLSCSQLFHAFNCRSRTESLFTLGVFSNMNLVYATLASLLLQMAVVSFPFLWGVFKTQLFKPTDWVLVILLSSFPLWAMEVVKWIGRRRNRPAA